jgi:hypothetical protein
VLIPGTIGGMLLFVFTDYARRRIDRRKVAAATIPPPDAPRPPANAGPGPEETRS